MGGFGIGVGLTHHDQRTLAHGSFHPVQIRHADEGIGCGHPPEVDLAPLHRFDLLPSGKTGCGRDAAGWKLPSLLNVLPMLIVSDQPIPRK